MAEGETYLRDSLELPIRVSLLQLGPHGREVDSGIITEILASLDDEHLSVGIFGEAGSQHQASSAASNDDEVELGGHCMRLVVTGWTGGLRMRDGEWRGGAL
jgi:hypothetical protein